MLGQLEAAHLPDLVAVAKAPMEIRGYGPVKDTAIAKVKPEVARLLTNLTTSVTQKMHAHG
jgi:indolepyruvate ferredoxin oxidoreductase